MKKEGVQSLKVDGAEISLSPVAFFKRTRTPKTEKKSDHIPTENFSDEDVLMWSVQNAGMNG